MENNNSNSGEYPKQEYHNSLAVGRQYLNRLNTNEVVEITGFGNKLMWGQTGKEDVLIVYYNVIKSSLGQFYTLPQRGETTQDNFLYKYITLEDLREDKLNQILSE